MTIKEVEQELGIPRATVRFYEKQQLIQPKRGENSYRDYRAEDVAILKKIIIFRKIGLSVAEVEEVLEGSTSLAEAMEKNIRQLQEQINELEGALRVSKQISDRHESLEAFDEKYYWEEIHQQEKAGNKFLDIANDVIKFEKRVILEQFDIADTEGNLRFGKTESFIRALAVCIVCGVCHYFLHDRTWKDFWLGCGIPFVYIVLHSIWGLPIHFIEKKNPKLAGKIRKAGNISAIIFVVLIFVFLIALAT